MASTVEYNSALQLIEIVFAGHTTAADLVEVTSRAITMIRERGVQDALVDATEMELAASAIDIFALPAKQYSEEGLDRRVRIGLIKPKFPKEKQDAQFYENACVNRGWLVKSFRNREEAIQWLKGSATPDQAEGGD